jgi:hypothetical protein
MLRAPLQFGHGQGRVYEHASDGTEAMNRIAFGLVENEFLREPVEAMIVDGEPLANLIGRATPASGSPTAERYLPRAGPGGSHSLDHLAA